MITQILWSGGVESTSYLKWFLEHTDDAIIAHHIHLINPEQRHEKEKEAIKVLMPKLKEIRDFIYIESRVEMECLSMDYELLYPIGAAAHRWHHCDRSYRCGCAEDAEIGHTHAQQVGQYAEFFPGHERAKLSKKEHWDYLGDLATLTWSCRRPAGQNKCGTCRPCIQIKAFT